MAGLRGAWVIVAATAWLGASEPVVAGSPISDQARFFSEKVHRQAEAEIAEIRAGYGVIVVVDTFSSDPLFGRLAGYLKGPEGRDQFLDGWSQRNAARRAGERGIYVAVIRHPAPTRIRVVVGSAAAQLFSPEKGEQLRAKLQSLFERDRFDDSLLAVVERVRTEIDGKQLSSIPLAEPLPWGTILATILLMLAFWMLLESGRALAKMGPPANASAAVGYGGGGSLPAAFFEVMTSRPLRPPEQGLAHDGN